MAKEGERTSNVANPCSSPHQMDTSSEGPSERITSQAQAISSRHPNEGNVGGLPKYAGSKPLRPMPGVSSNVKMDNHDSSVDERVQPVVSNQIFAAKGSLDDSKDASHLSQNGGHPPEESSPSHSSRDMSGYNDKSLPRINRIEVFYVQDPQRERQRQKLLLKIRDLTWKRMKSEAGFKGVSLALLNSSDSAPILAGMMKFEPDGKTPQQETGRFSMTKFVLLCGQLDFFSGRSSYKLEPCAHIKVPPRNIYAFHNRKQDDVYIYFNVQRHLN